MRTAAAESLAAALVSSSVPSPWTFNPRYETLALSSDNRIECPQWTTRGKFWNGIGSYAIRDSDASDRVLMYRYQRRPVTRGHGVWIAGGCPKVMTYGFRSTKRNAAIAAMEPPEECPDRTTHSSLMTQFFEQSRMERSHSSRNLVS